MEWNSPVSTLKGIGEQRERKLQKLDIYTIEDLLTHYPREYKDRSEIIKIADLPMDEPSTFLAQIKEEGQNSRHGRLVYTRMKVYDETGSVGVLWYNQPYMKNSLKMGEWYLFSGKLQKKYGRKEILSPECERIGENFAGGRIIPVYPASVGISQKMLRNLMEEALSQMSGGMREELPLWLRKEYKLAERNFAIENIHFPKTEQGFYDARRRLVFEELFILQTALYQLKNTLEDSGEGIILKKKKALQEGEALLPFALTNAQKRVLKEIEKDMTSGKIMNRLVQGDVGSGKTAVAIITAYWAIKNGYQATIMAPTEVLANQHFESFQKIFEPVGIEVVLLTGSLKAKEKRETLEKVANGEAQMIVGTHAVIQKGVEFYKLGLAITDEQHRFGVRQRSTLADKGENVHTLVMTATPIPRTLALILYGDLDISIIDELPPGRQKIDTSAVDSRYHQRIYAFIQKHVAAGRQAYVICPMIEESEKLEVQSVLNYTEELVKELPDCRVACVHGKMKAKEKQEIMDGFAAGNIDVLVSTTVIEVGINVPNATIMLIENAERFGLAQLHQLRGRVGRGSEKSYCILVSDTKTKVAKERMKTMTESEDGFVISEKDLKLRGPGEFFGIRQHGLPELKIADLYKDMAILKEAQSAAAELLKKDRALEAVDHQLLREHIEGYLEEKSLEM
ncbi:ATP-dependent DNA helicase RecG [Anaerotignum sp.]|nr:ATP-dependent DNA helicase RecG [Anaerotignum sp.]MBQ7759113.1 ATP-dependent DNA helicase RecG [Anaerotignum sp.]